MICVSMRENDPVDLVYHIELGKPERVVRVCAHVEPAVQEEVAGSDADQIGVRADFLATTQRGESDWHSIPVKTDFASSNFQTSCWWWSRNARKTPKRR